MRGWLFHLLFPSALVHKKEASLLYLLVLCQNRMHYFPNVAEIVFIMLLPGLFVLLNWCALLQKSSQHNDKYEVYVLVSIIESFSLDSIDSIDENGDAKVSIFSVAMSLRRKEKSGKPMPLQLRPQTKATKNWLKALHLTRERDDPWEKFHLDELPVEKAVRHRYNALTKTWSTEDVVVKMDSESFAEGAMRECYRM